MPEFEPIPTHPLFQDLTGQTFGRLTVLGYAGRLSGNTVWWCQCSCGSPPKMARDQHLKRGKVVSCGCYKKELPNGRFRDLTEQTFGRLTVIRPTGRSKRGHALFLCQCSCGSAPVEIPSTNLKNGNTASCGCLKREQQTTHGQTGTREHAAWGDMRYRCSNPGNAAYYLYGARGIRVCDRYQNSFEAFLADLGKCPRGHSLDRIDNARGYDCGKCADCLARGATANCRWATPKQQQRNRRGNILLTWHGETLCVAEWAERLGLVLTTLRNRLKVGWSIERALSEPTNTAYSSRLRCS